MNPTIGQPFTGAPPPMAPRVVHDFDVPEEYQGDGEHKITRVGILELTAGEEVMAARRAGNDQMSQAQELVKQAIGDINGTVVTIGDGTSEMWFNRMTAPLRTLLVGAYAEIHSPTIKANASFMKSRKVRTR